MITLTPLSSSAASSSSSEPVCYLLQLDGARILLDLGQRDYRANAQRTSWAYEEAVRELAPTLSLVLLSHSPATYLSLYPYARARWGLKCPVYATQPTVEMGRVVCLAEAESWRGEWQVDDSPDTGSSADGAAMQVARGETRLGGPIYESDGLQNGTTSGKGKKPLRGPFVPTVDEVHEAFDAIKSIRYNQPLHLGGELSHLLLTPFPSGHTLGGTLFKIRSPTSGTVLYAVGINHTAERHLDGMVNAPGCGPSGYADGVLRPDLLIVEGGRNLVVNPKRREREKAVIDIVTQTLEARRSLLMPCDPSPRLLELLVLFNQHWTFKLTSNPSEWQYPICVVSRTAEDMLAFARSLVEWMGGMVRDSGEEDVVEVEKERRGKKGRRRIRAGAMGSEFGALEFKHIRFFDSPTSLLSSWPLKRPQLVLAFSQTLSHGPSRWLFTAMATAEGNVILLTTRGEEGTLARDLFDRWEQAQEDEAKWGRGKIGRPERSPSQLKLDMHSKVPLAGAELEAHLDAERLQKEREAAHQAALDRSRRMLEADDLDSDSDSDSEATPDDGIIISSAPRGVNTFAPEGDEARQMSFDIFVKGQQMRAGRGGDGGGMRFRMFPFLERRGRKVDEYGEGLDIGVWVRKGREIEEEGETEDVREAKRRKVEEEERQKEPPEPPSKYLTEQAIVDLNAAIMYVDMDGLLDGQATKTIISDLQPRKLALIRSTAESTQALLSDLASLSVTKDVFAPGTNEEVVLGEHIASYSITLGDSISAGLGAKWSKFEGYEVVMVDGKVAFSAGSTVPTIETASIALGPAPAAKIEEIESSAAPQTQPEPDVQPEEAIKTEPISPSRPNISLPAAAPGPALGRQAKITPNSLPSSLFVGDLRLAALKARLSKQSIPAEYTGEGVLICGPGVLGGGAEAKSGSIVAVRKLGEGRIVLEGSVGRVYFAVRRELYGGLAQVSGA